MNDPRIETLQGCYTSVIHDVMRAMGGRNFTLPPRITPLQPELTLCGPALRALAAHDGYVTEADRVAGK